METEVNTTSRILNYTERRRAQGDSYKDIADSLDISTRTLRRYRNGESRAGPGVQEKMQKGGKLTQLEQAQTTREVQEDPDPGDFPGGSTQPEPGGPALPEGSVPEPPRDVVQFEDIAPRPTPTTAPEAIFPVGREDTPQIDRAIKRGGTLELEMNEYEMIGGERRFTVGEQDVGEKVQTHTLRYDLDAIRDAVELGNNFWEDIIEIIYG